MTGRRGREVAGTGILGAYSLCVVMIDVPPLIPEKKASREGRLDFVNAIKKDVPD